MRVVKLQHQCQILSGSPKGFTKGVKENTEGITWDSDGFEDGQVDY